MNHSGGLKKQTIAALDESGNHSQVRSPAQCQTQNTRDGLLPVCIANGFRSPIEVGHFAGGEDHQQAPVVEKLQRLAHTRTVTVGCQTIGVYRNDEFAQAVHFAKRRIREELDVAANGQAE